MTEPGASPVANPELLLQRIKHTFPDLLWKVYQYIDEGWDHQVIILDRNIVFRFPDTEYLPLLQTEIEVLKSLHDLVNVNIPKYTYIAPDFSFAGYPLVPGEILSSRAFHSLSPDDQRAVAKQMARFLSTMHTFMQKQPDFNYVMHSDMAEQQEQLKEQTNRHLKSILSEPDFIIVKEILADTEVLLKQPLPRVLNHGDVYSNNLLWDSTHKQLGIIDFSDMNLGDPAFDFAELYEYGADFVGEVYHQYTAPKDAAFLDRAWVYQKWVGVYMMVDHFSSSKTSFEIARKTFDRTKNMQDTKLP